MPEKLLMWKQKGSTIFTFQGRAYVQQIMRARLDDYEQHVKSSITMMAGIGVSTCGFHLPQVGDTGIVRIDGIQLTNMEAPEGAAEHSRGEGESAITAPPFFKHAGRGATDFVGTVESGTGDQLCFYWKLSTIRGGSRSCRSEQTG